MIYFVPRLGKAVTMFGLPNDNKYLLLLILAYIGLNHAVLEEKGRMKLKYNSIALSTGSCIISLKYDLNI